MMIPHQQLVTVSHQIPTLATPVQMLIPDKQLVTVSSPPQIWLSSQCLSQDDSYTIVVTVVVCESFDFSILLPFF